MVVIAAGTSDPYRVVGASVFGATLVLLQPGFLTLYHSVKGRSKNVLQKFDHCAIYLLIAGSYTPYALASPCRVPGAGPCSAWIWDWPHSASCRR